MTHFFAVITNSGEAATSSTSSTSFSVSTEVFDNDLNWLIAADS